VSDLFDFYPYSERFGVSRELRTSIDNLVKA
jgi:hypothetical protein